MDERTSSIGSTSDLFLRDSISSSRRKRPSGTNYNGHQSLIAAMDKFLVAIEKMDDTVMMPSRLLDIPLTTDPFSSVSCKSKEKSGVSDCDSGVSVHDSSAIDLHSFYKLLKSAKTDLTTGPAASEQIDDQYDDLDSGWDSLSESDDNCSTKRDSNAREVTGAFRHHLIGLFASINLLTEGAQYLTTRYEEELSIDGNK